MVLLWSGVHFTWYKDRSLFFFYCGSTNASMYIVDAFQNHIVLYIPLVGADSLFMQDNMYPHMAQWMLKFLKEVEIAQFE